MRYKMCSVPLFPMDSITLIHYGCKSQVQVGVRFERGTFFPLSLTGKPSATERDAARWGAEDAPGAEESFSALRSASRASRCSSRKGCICSPSRPEESRGSQRSAAGLLLTLRGPNTSHTHWVKPLHLV